MAEYQGHGRIVDAAGGKDSATIQGAIANLGLTGGSIFVRKGTYTESVVVPALQQNLLIELEPGAIVKAVGAAVSLQIGAGAQNITIRGGQWRGVAGAAAGVVVDPGTRVDLEGLIIGSTVAADKVTDGISIGASAQVFIRGCSIISAARGVVGAASIAEVTIADSQILDPTSDGIQFAASGIRVVVTGNIIKNAGGRGISVQAIDGGIVGNQIYNPAGTGIYLGSSQRLVVASNQIYSTEQWGIEGDAAVKPTNSVVIGNLIVAPTVGEYTNLDGSGMVVTSNTPSDNPGALHTRLHAIAGSLDHNAGTHKVFYSDGAGLVQELSLGANGTFLKSLGATSAPQFASAGAASSIVTDLTGTPWRVFYVNATGNVVELALGANGTVMRGKGAAAAPAFETEFGTPALSFGTAAGAGVATTGIRTDATLPLFDVTVPVTQAYGDAAAVGVAAVAARRDHVHGMPAEFKGFKKVSAGTGNATQLSLASLTGYRRYKLLIVLGDGPAGNIITAQINAAVVDWALATYSTAAISHSGATGSGNANLSAVASAACFIELDVMHHANGYRIIGISRVGGASNTFAHGVVSTQGAAASINQLLVNWVATSTYTYILLGTDDVT